MIRYTGTKTSLKIYVLNKPIKCYFRKFVFKLFKGGFRAFVLCESTSGYVLK